MREPTEPAEPGLMIGTVTPTVLAGWWHGDE
jgi:hypothetical protein